MSENDTLHYMKDFILICPYQHWNTTQTIWVNSMRQTNLVWHQRGDRSANLMVRLGFAFGSKQDEQKSANGTKSFGLMRLFPHTFMSQINCQRGIHMSSSWNIISAQNFTTWLIAEAVFFFFCPCCFLLLFRPLFEPGEEYHFLHGIPMLFTLKILFKYLSGISKWCFMIIKRLKGC